MSDEVHFSVSGYVNKQECSYWAPKNRHELHQRPLHSAKVTVWCAVSCYGSIGPYFFGIEEGCTVSVDAERCKVMSEIFLRIELHPHQQFLLWFQQDGATVHTLEISMQVLRTMFPGTWPARSPDIAVQNYFLWGYVKNKVYETHTANIANLKQ
jgi:hypothetical protein